uniref:Dynein light chain n=1 Tax=Percolomonas cosmopolitus TaxID=63605 RepID=A0A7S1PJH4_9EUKA|mmetsp:Transcript_9483/g.35193  ORF Transcript_9483/g.35193 Transcript_9483/m.35193 type:complete len:134 (+) Transcript_9483:42-443(+)
MSVISENEIQPEIIVYKNSYRMYPKKGEKFLKSDVEHQMKLLLERELKTVQYSPKEALNHSKSLTGKIISMLKEMGYPRYKFVAQVVISSVEGQGMRVASRSLWDPQQDNFATVSFKNASLMCVALVFGCFFE